MPTLVLGSKPDPLIPELNYDTVVYVNHSILHKPEITKSNKHNHIITNYLLRKEENHTVIEDKQVDNLYRINSAPAGLSFVTLESLNYSYTSKTVMSKSERYNLTISFFGWWYPLRVLLTRNYKYWDYSDILKDLARYLKKKELNLAKMSSGLFALTLALSEEMGGSPYILSGVGLSPGGHQHDNEHQYSASKHGPADKIALESIARDERFHDKVFSTEPEIYEATSIKKWK